ncbi:hypothetical protein QUA30_23630 [Microcoleus sp. Pol14C2]|uniref:hypothetical protein n=1 Tax=unclassified Microcoleus TaxID=2642155 RepID=UPI002FD38CEB
MFNYQIQTPIAFIIFKRLDTTARVFEAIRQAKPPKLLVIADGPCPDRPGEDQKCAVARAIIDQVDWDCEVLNNYDAYVNLGCRLRVSSGMNWVFDRVEEAIILEDDLSLLLLFSPSLKNCWSVTETLSGFCQSLVKMFSFGEKELIIVTTFLAIITAGFGRVGGELGSIMI